MDGKPFVVSALINSYSFANTLIDTGCLSYGLCDPRFAQKNGLTRLKITPRSVTGVDGKLTAVTDEVVAVDLDLDGHKEERVFLYLSPIGHYDMILGMPWVTTQDARINGPRSEMRINTTGTVVRSREAFSDLEETLGRAVNVSAASFEFLRARKRKNSPCRIGQKKVEVFAASMADINKALAAKKYTDPKDKMPTHFHQWLDVADRKKAELLPPARGQGIDHSIELEKDDHGREKEVPWGPLYNMSRDELLVLRKTLTDLLDKGFIRVSNSPAAAPVLFVKKPGGGLRFCVDYRGLNRITKKDRYPLPLIYETLRSISKAKWFTKLDVIAAFHKLRILEGDEWKTAFRTRYGLYEWMVTPFGLANAPSTFQKYVNWALRDYLDEFCSAYVDDILIYSSGSRQQHRGHVRKVLQRLREAGLQIDIDKCEFEVQETKYLGFIIEAGKGLRMDPEKVKAIAEWEAPTSVKGVRSFLGFANFYRRFIKDYSDVVRPLTDLTHKDRRFAWSPEADAAFERLKAIFTSAPALAQFDFDRETRIETDSSGWCIGGTLQQLTDDGLWVSCAFFSKKNNPAECNYEIHDKELLAIIRCLEEWDAELRGVDGFEIHTDHKNLEYFMTVRKLTERQMRWSLILSRYKFKIVHVPGKSNERADALSRRDQDLPKNALDNRLLDRHMQLLRPEVLAAHAIVRTMPVRTRKNVQAAQRTIPDVPIIVGELPDELADWNEAVANDEEYQAIRKAVKDKERKMPPEYKLKVSITECTLSLQKDLLFRGRRWVPSTANLRTRIIQGIHDSVIGGHPGREATYAFVARQFFWPGMSMDVRDFTNACDGCGRNKSWRSRRKGFLKPLPIPDRIWSEISMDFITELPESEGCRNMIVITDRLGKGVVADGLDDLEAETVAKWFIRRYYPHHFLPFAIVSDRGTQFTGALWTRICQILRIKRRLSTAFSPETDGATERMNQVVEAFLREFVNHAQDDWLPWLSIAVAAICGRDSTSTGLNPFFLSHGWHQDLFEDFEDELSAPNARDSPIVQADRILRKLKDLREWAQAAMATAQEAQEKAANRGRIQAPAYRVGDKVWLSLENIATDRPSKKLDAKYAKYTVIEVVGSHNYRLDTPPGIHDVFHTRLLKPAQSNPLPGQVIHESQPPALMIDEDGEGMYEIDEILDQKKARGGKEQYLVKWTGYAKPTWTPASALEFTAALDDWKARVRTGLEPVGGRKVRRKVRKDRKHSE
jgi:hypothetical protein